MENTPFVRIERPHDGVATLILDRPQAMNAVSTQLAVELTAAAEELAADRTVRAVVLASSATKAFCVGADLKERNSFSDDDLRKQRPTARASYASVLNLPMPTIAAVEGHAMGGGLELALSCDLIVASQTANMALPEVSVGVIPGGGGTQLLVRRVGWSRACDLIFTARRVNADEGHRLGFVDRVVEAEQARSSAEELATTIAAHSPVGTRQAKHAMRVGMELSLPAGLDIEDGAWRTTAFSGDRAEGVRAFAEKRTPNWPGE